MSEKRQGSFLANLFLGAIRFYQRNISPLLSRTVSTDLLALNMQFKLYKSTVLKREVGLLLSVLLAATLFIREDTIPFRKGTHRRKYVGLDC